MTEPLAPGSSFEVDFAPPSMSEADLLAVLDRVLPEWYLEPLKNPGPGYEWFQAVAAMLERVSRAVATTEASTFILYSAGGAQSACDVEFYRGSTLSGGFSVKAGTVVRTSRTNRSYVVAADVRFGPDDLAVPARVLSVGQAPEYDVPGPTTTADGTELPGEIDVVAIPILDPVLAEPTIQVRQVGDASGGAAPVLDQHGLDRALPRVSGEPDEVYKGRIRQLPDTVSPAALRRQLDSVFLPMELAYELVETWQNEYQTCYDFSTADLVHPTMGTAAADCFALDDPRASPFRGRLLDERDHLSGLVVVVPEVGSWSQRALAFDDTADSTGAGGTLGPGSTFARVRTLTDFLDQDNPLSSGPIPTNGDPWDATIECLVAPGDGPNGLVGTSGTVAGLGLSIAFVASGPTHVEVRDRQRWNQGSASWLDEDGTVGVLVSSLVDGPSVGDIEAAINAASLLVRVSVPDSSPGKLIPEWFIAEQTAAIAPFSGGVASNVTARGWRARSALDAPDVDGNQAAGSFVRVPFLDGYDLLHDQFYLHLFDLLRQVKGGGTNSAIELEGQ